MKPRAGPPPTAAEKRHHDRVRALGCLISRGPATIHHVTGYADRPGRFSRSHRLVVPLAPKYHQIQHGSRESVEALSHQGFARRYGIDLFATAKRFRTESINLGILPQVEGE